MFRLAIVLLFLILGPMAARAEPACEVRQRTSIPLTLANGGVVVPLEVNGIAARFILDTGAERSIVAEDSIPRLGLARDTWVGTTMGGIGGLTRRANADPRSLSLGGVPLVRATLNHDTSLVVSPLLRGRPEGQGIDGLLGRDFLSLFDVDLDVPSRRMTIYTVEGCSGRFLPWTGNYASVPASSPMAEALVVAVSLDGVPLRALLDTGATSSMLAAPGMARMGLGLSRMSGDPARAVSGVGPRAVTMRWHTFRQLQVDTLVAANPAFLVAPVRITPIVDMLLGLDWLARRRVWLSFTTKQVFVASS